VNFTHVLVSQIHKVCYRRKDREKPQDKQENSEIISNILWSWGLLASKGLIIEPWQQRESAFLFTHYWPKIASKIGGKPWILLKIYIFFNIFVGVDRKFFIFAP